MDISRGHRLLWALKLTSWLVGCDASLPPPDASGTYDPCCSDLGRCVPSGLIPEAFAGMVDRDSCQAALSCVPRELLNEQQAPTSCTSSVLGAEGRCLPDCLPPVKQRAAALAEDGCGAQRLCVPCFEPLSGEPTGVCTLGRDPGPVAKPRLFADCCAGAGRCVPGAVVPEAYVSMLGQDQCPAAQLCVAPHGLLEAQDSFVPSSCFDEVLGSEGRCLPDCLPVVAAQASRLRVASCPPASLCVPCFDPVTGDDSGACRLGADPGSSRPPQLLADCCGGLGRCAPESTVPSDVASKLGRDSCAASQLCVAPELFLTELEGARLEPCFDERFGAEGRCVPECIPFVHERAASLSAASCPGGMLCAPCYDPVTGSATGACALGSDPGPAQPPAKLAACCGGAGRCALGALVPGALRAQFERAECVGDDQLCVAPLAALEDPSGFRPTACVDSLLQAEGRCLPACLPAVAAQAGRLRRETCTPESLCVPCFDPVSGKSTGACDNNGDAPGQPGTTWPACCVVGNEPLGVCVMPALIGSSELQLPAQSCTDSTVCAPRALAADPGAKLTPCTSLGDPGACLPFCFLSAAQQLVLQQGSCTAGEDCVPCRFFGAPTGVCGT